MTPPRCRPPSGRRKSGGLRPPRVPRRRKSGGLRPLRVRGPGAGETRRRLLVRSCAQIQTESQLWHRAGIKEDNTAKADVKRNRLLQMYNALQKRYEEEIKANKRQSETVSKLTLMIHELELQLVTSKQRIQQLEHVPVQRRRKMSTLGGDSACHKGVSGGASTCSPGCINTELLFKIEKLQKERDKLTKEKISLKNELAGLDKGFFEEIEDLKYALQESAKLNKEYEKCLQTICERQGLSFPQHFFKMNLM
ncbi:centrosomal protein of 290 kDa-like isoform X2 [Narcine bancroftii]|uniref:centrosomal protein of 290 kDa-like isoform X2 n=1 Tax=Narcine bancroftii TaxID=1343680 RepID=UPI00383212F3